MSFDALVRFVGARLWFRCGGPSKANNDPCKASSAEELASAEGQAFLEWRPGTLSDEILIRVSPVLLPLPVFRRFSTALLLSDPMSSPLMKLIEGRNRRGSVSDVRVGGSAWSGKSHLLRWVNVT